LAAHTYRERAEIRRGLTEESLTSCRGPSSKIINNRVFANGHLKKDIREGRGGIVLVSAQNVEAADNIIKGNRGPGIQAKSGDRQRTSRVSIHHNSLRNDTLRGCKLAGVVCRANRM
jgi:D-Tyr-tRNAtyr deacylase